MTPHTPKVLSFVSGKGGVGKTSIAANYAWVSAQTRKTVLIDMDLQNQGMTGLLEPFLDRAPLGAFELLAGPDRQIDVDSCLVRLADDLHFLPAASAKMDPSAVELAGLLSNPSVGESIQRLVAHLRDTIGYEVLIMDCHGGLDYLSLGAHYASDVTIVVTEADTVTFKGTLELMSFYQAIPDEALWSLARREPTHRTVTQLVLNRIPAKYRFADLDGVYRKLLDQTANEYHLAPEVLSYLPHENFLMDNFGDYPFSAELAPNSVFAKKLWLMDFDLNGPATNPAPDMAMSLQFATVRKRIRHCIISNEERNTRRMLSSFGVLTVAFTAFLAAFVPYVLMALGHLHAAAFALGLAYSQHLSLRRFIVFLVFCGPAAVSGTLVRALWGAVRFYTDRFRFKRSLCTVSGRKAKLGDRILLARLLLMRILLVFPLVVFAAVAVFLPVIGYFQFFR